MLLPPARLAEVGEGERESRIVPAQGYPAGPVHLAHDAQGFNQGQFGDIEIAEFGIAFEQAVERSRRRGEHPQVLHGRAHACVIQIDEMRAGIGPQDIAAVAIAVQADVADGRARLQALLEQAGEAFAGVGIARAQAGRQQFRAKHGAGRGPHECLDIDAAAFVERRARSHAVDACKQAAHPGEILGRFQFRRTPALARIQAEAEACMLEQGLPVDQQRCHHRQFRLRKFECEIMFFINGRIAPATGAIELGDQRCRRLDADLIDAVFVAAQCQHAPIGLIAGSGHRIEDQIRAERCIRSGARVHRITPPCPNGAARRPWSGAKYRPGWRRHPRCGFPRPGSNGQGAAVAPCR